MSDKSLTSASRKEKYKYRSTVFLICLTISAFIWLLIKLSDTYTTEITIPIRYKEIPQGKILINKVDSSIRIGITDQGFALAWIKYFSPKTPLKINLSQYRLKEHMHEYEALISTQAWSQNFLDQYDLGGEIQYIIPDTIAFYFEDRYSKVVPVKNMISINFKKQFFAYDTMTITPKTVTISGLNKTINKIEAVETEPVSFNDLSTSIDATVRLKKPVDDPDIQISPSEINVKLEVEKFTESQIEVPIETLRMPPDHRIKIFPEKVTIKYLVALKDFKKINEDMFVCTVDLSRANSSIDDKLEVSLTTTPQFIKVVSIEPLEVDYLVLK